MSSQRTAAPRVLLVEDYPDTRTMYAIYLRHCGFEVLEAPDGLEALRVAEAERPDVIVMDLGLPGLDGWEATRRLKGNPATRSIPVVALTGHGLAGRKERPSCDAFLLKPCLPDVLVEQLRRLLNTPRGASAN